MIIASEPDQIETSAIDLLSERISDLSLLQLIQRLRHVTRFVGELLYARPENPESFLGLHVTRDTIAHQVDHQVPDDSQSDQREYNDECSTRTHSRQFYGAWSYIECTQLMQL